MNRATILGRICADLSPKTTTNTTLLNFTVAVDRKYHKPGEEKQTDFINLVSFGKTAENIAKYFKKGSRILVSGAIQTRKYTNKDKQEVHVTEIVVEDFDFIDAKTEETSAPQYRSDGERRRAESKKQTEIDSTSLPFDL